ncbi:MAG: NADP-dependent isocitrate dehydrogenase, partial [Acidobacteria bacterium]|nr:NADP-dependent isocitrate dehydrogenase [Acidobacteriota bacterium]
YVCLRPVRYFQGVPSPVKHPERMNLIIFRENTEDVYAGIEWASGSEEARRVIELAGQLGKKIRPDSGIGIKPISRTGSQKLVRRAIQYALEHGGKTVTLVHKGNIMKFTEGAFRDWGYELAKAEFRNHIVTERESWILDNQDKNPSLPVEANAALIEPGLESAPEAFKKQVCEEVKACLEAIGRSHGNGQWKKKILVNDRIADSMFQQVQTRAEEYDVVCTPNLNGDYLSDACAAQIGGLGVAPGANIGDGYGLFEATHGTAPKYADKDVINPSSVMLSGALMFEFLGWKDVAQLIEQGIARTIAQKTVTYDLERLMEGAKKVKTSEYATAIIANL